MVVAALADRAGFSEIPRFALRAVRIRRESGIANARAVAGQSVRAFSVMTIRTRTAIRPVKPVQTLLAVLLRVATLAAVGTQISRTDELDRQLRRVRVQRQRAVEHHRHEILAFIAVFRVASVDCHVHLQRTRRGGRFAGPIEVRRGRIAVDGDEHRSRWEKRRNGDRERKSEEVLEAESVMGVYSVE